MGDSRSHPNGFTVFLSACHLAQQNDFDWDVSVLLQYKYEIEILFCLFTLIKGGLCAWLLNIYSSECIPNEKKLYRWKLVYPLLQLRSKKCFLQLRFFLNFKKVVCSRGCLSQCYYNKWLLICYLRSMSAVPIRHGTREINCNVDCSIF